MAPLSTTQKSQMEEYNVPFSSDSSSEVDHDPSGSAKEAVSSPSKIDNEVKFNPSPSSKSYESGIDFKKRREMVLESASSRIPQIIQVMSRANDSLGHDIGNEVKEMRSLWHSGHKKFTEKSKKLLS